MSILSFSLKKLQSTSQCIFDEPSHTYFFSTGLAFNFSSSLAHAHLTPTLISLAHFFSISSLSHTSSYKTQILHWTLTVALSPPSLSLVFFSSLLVYHTPSLHLNESIQFAYLIYISLDVLNITVHLISCATFYFLLFFSLLSFNLPQMSHVENKITSRSLSLCSLHQSLLCLLATFYTMQSSCIAGKLAHFNCLERENTVNAHSHLHVMRVTSGCNHASRSLNWESTGPRGNRNERNNRDLLCAVSSQLTHGESESVE